VRKPVCTNAWTPRAFPRVTRNDEELAGWQGKPIVAGAIVLAATRDAHLLISIAKDGMISGFGFGSASTHDQRLMETYLAARARPIAQLASGGEKAQGVSIEDKGFAGALPHTRWRAHFGAEVITPAHQSSKEPWPKEWRRWLAHLRQLLETVYEKLLNAFRLARERPHALTGFQAPLAAKVSLHNFCIWLNGFLQRDPLAFANLLDW
jgi:hypothetical protein